MMQRYIFYYDKTKPAWKKEIVDKLIAHDGMECSVDIEDFGVLDIVSALFDDGIELNVYVYELEEVNEELVDIKKIICGLEHCAEDNCTGCPYEKGTSNCLGSLHIEAIKCIKKLSHIKE